jgi:hypothetical protein
MLASSVSGISSARFSNQSDFLDLILPNFGAKSNVREPSEFSVLPIPSLTSGMPTCGGVGRSTIEGNEKGFLALSSSSTSRIEPVLLRLAIF